MPITTGQNALASDFIDEAAADATPANDAGRVSKLESNGKISDFFLLTKFRETLTTHEDIDGSSTPVACTVDADGEVVSADANNTNHDEFLGFVNEAVTIDVGAYVNKTASSSNTFNHDAPAGNKRIVVFCWAGSANGTTPTKPTGVTWGGNAMTEIVSLEEEGATISWWYYVAGDSGSVTSGDIVVSGASASEGELFTALTYEEIDQSTPIDDSGSATKNSSSGSSSVSPTRTQSKGISVIGLASRSSTISTDAPNTRESSTDSTLALIIEDEISYIGEESIGYTFDASAYDRPVTYFLLNNANTGSAPLITGGILDGFSGLTPGARYYVQDTRGTIGTSAGTTSLLVGKALSATKLRIIHD